MTARNPSHRPATMRAIASEIDRVLAEPKPTMRRPLLITLATAAICSLITLGVWLAWPPRPEDPPTTPSVPDTAWLTDQGFLLVQPGEFLMGSADQESDASAAERPQHRVQITRSFWLNKYEVTQGEFFDLMGTNCSVFSTEGRGIPRYSAQERRKFPVESVPWLVALDYCNKLSVKHGLPPYYTIDKEIVKVQGGPGFRLPTEAEWEYACRAGTTTRWSFGDDKEKLDDYAWSARNSNRSPHPVGEKKPNLWGFYDMHGNVPEWCWDRFDPGYYKRSVACDPSGSGEGQTRVYRGGSWNHQEAQLRSADRNSLGLGYGPLATIGFRVARDSD